MSDSDNALDGTLAFFYSLYSEVVNENLHTGILYGLYIAAYVTSVNVLLRKPGFTSSPHKIFMFGITTFMFALGIVALALEKTFNIRYAKLIIDPTLSDTSYIRGRYVWVVITCLMYILCDVICAWRAAVLWNKDKRVITILATFILGTTVSAGWAIAFELDQGVFVYDDSHSMGKRNLIVTGPTLGTNLLSTGLIAWKAWKRRIQVREHLREGSGRGSVRVDRVFALLIESGLIYGGIWVLYCFAKSGMLPDPGFTAMAFVSGLYPTLIIILVSKQMSPIEHYSNRSTGMQIMLASALRPPRDNGIVLAIYRDYTSDSDIQSPSAVFMKPSDEERNREP